MRNILSVEQARETVTGRTICSVCGNDTNNLNTVSAMKICDGTTTNAINSDTVNEISLSKVLPCADIPREETESIRFNSGESKPTDLVADAERRSEWEKFYNLAWELKYRLMKKYHCRISFPIMEDDIF
jgi:hypothetical protein